MKKETLHEIVLATVGGIITAIGMCFCLIPEWEIFKPGVAVTIVGVLLLLCIIPLYRKSHPKKERRHISASTVATWLAGIAGALVMGFGMSKAMVENADKIDMIIGIITGVFGLAVCVLNYPIYSFIKGNKN